MPYAADAETAHRWATERAVALWVVFAADLGGADLAALAPGLASATADGARVALVVPPGTTAIQAERALAGVVVEGAAPPAPFGVFAALEAAGVDDARRLGVVGASVAALEAGHRAGAGAIVGVAATPDARRPLLPGQPDVVVAPDGFAALDAARYAAGRAHRQRVLLNPGPAVVSDRVHRAVAGPDLCHREPEYADLLDGITRKLFRVAGASDDWALAMLAGSGTAALEAMTGAAVRPNRRLLVAVNGLYGERIALIADRLGIATATVSSPDLDPIEPTAVAAALDADPTIDAVAVVHHETTTGLLNPVAEIARAAQERGVVVLVDAISSLGAETLDLAGLDFVASTSNKCLHGLPGASFILLSPAAQARIAAVPPRSLYFDLGGYLKAQAERTVPFTPAIPALYGLDAALDELLDEGLAERRAAYRARMAFLDGAFARLGLEPRVAPPHRSASVRSLPLPPGQSYARLHDRLKRDGYIIYAGLGAAAASSFRVCALGALTVPALAGFVVSLERAMARDLAGAAVGPAP